MLEQMENIINIENKNLCNYIMFKLDKLENGFTESELNQITEVVIDYNNEDESSFVFLKELLKLKNLNAITLRNGYIYNENFNIFIKLNNLRKISFDNCEFENADTITSLKLTDLSLINCKIENYNFILTFNSLEQLTIINGKIEMEKINMLKNLKFLQLSYSNILDSVELDIDSLEELYIDNTNIIKFNFINNLYNLKKLCLDEKQYKNNKIMFENLRNKFILILNKNIVGFGDEYNGL